MCIRDMVLTDSTDFSVSAEIAAEDAQEEFTTEDVQDAFAAEAQQGEAYVLIDVYKRQAFR